MATALVHVLPPSLNYRNQAPHYDRHQFSGKRTSQRLVSYSDQHNMHVIKRVGRQERRLQTPTWAMNDELLRVMLVRFMECRAYQGGYCDQTGTLQERLVRAEKKLATRIPGLQARLEKFILEYRQVQSQHISNSEKTERLEELETEIKNVDAQIRLFRKPGGVAGAVLRCVHLYYGLGWNSVEVANEILPSLDPMWVHQVLYKLNHNAEAFLS